jgi:hypothetical protein
MPEKLRMGISKWRDVILLLGIFGGLSATIALGNRSFGQVETSILYLDRNQKGVLEKLEEQGKINAKTIATLDKIELRQTASEERMKEFQISTDVEIMKLLKKNNLFPERWNTAKK